MPKDIANAEQTRLLADSKVQTAEEQARPAQEQELLSDNALGLQNLDFRDGLGAEICDTASNCDGDAAPESAEPSAAPLSFGEAQHAMFRHCVQS